jgi:tRNA threonylcarbamoyladenosine biosynthesis protein TsaB
LARPGLAPGDYEIAMLILAADTTTPSGSVALLRDEVVLGEVDLDTPGTHSASLLPSIDFLLRAQGLNVEAVDGFAVAAGPGSFTGIRIGLSVVKALAYASGRAVAPVSTLEALAAKLEGPRPGLACPLLDAKRGEVYAALFELKSNLRVEIIPQAAYDPEAFLSRLPTRRVVSFIGNGLGPYRARVLAYARDKARFPKRSPFIAVEVGRLGAVALRQGRGVAARELRPLYFRKSQAEEKGQP